MTPRTIHSRECDTALFLLRAVVGAVFVMHGVQKLFVMGFDGVAVGFQQMGIPYPEIAARVVALVEFFGGMLLVLGLFTRLAAMALAINMIVAIAFVHLPNGFFLPDGYEFALTLLVGNLSLLAAGAGAFSLDAWLKHRRYGWEPAGVPMVHRHA